LKVEAFIPLDRILVIELAQASLISGVQPVFQLGTRSNWRFFTEETRSTPSMTEG